MGTASTSCQVDDLPQFWYTVDFYLFLHWLSLIWMLFALQASGAQRSLLCYFFFFFSSYGSTADLVLCILQPLLLEAHGIQLTLLVSHEHEQTCMGGKSVVYVIVSVRPAREIL